MYHHAKKQRLVGPFILPVAVAILACSTFSAAARNNHDQTSWAILAADEMLTSHPHYINYDAPSLAWDYPQALVLHALWNVWLQTHDRKYFDYVKASADFYLPDSGGIRSYVRNAFRLDDVLMGRTLLDLYESTGDAKYKNAAIILRAQLDQQPRTPEGGFWHKEIYPDQMWLDGLYMAEPFYAHYAVLFDQPQDFSDIAKQFILMAKHARDPKTGLMYHGWDFTRRQVWADPKTGDSKSFWGRAMGWYLMGLVDALDYFPENYPQRQELTSIFRNLCGAVLKYQDKKSHLWYQVVDQAGRSGNYLESSSSAMFAYSFTKGAMLGYLDRKFLHVGKCAFDGLVANLARVSHEMDTPCSSRNTGMVAHLVLENISGSAGLGGVPYRDGSYDYYVGIPKETNDFRGVGPFILAAIAIENARECSQEIGEGKVVGLDYYFNDEWKKDTNGIEHRFHYVWEDTEDTGYSHLGEIIKGLGARLASLKTAPAERSLDIFKIYMIVDPDTPIENPNPHYIDDKPINTIVRWVKRGGVLALFANDSGNCEFVHLNKLAGHFGIHFNEDSRNRVKGKDYDVGTFAYLPEGPTFSGVTKIFMKEISTLKISGSARAELVDHDNVIMASSKFGKGYVFAVGDPWFYNEYMDHRKLPVDFENGKAARNLFYRLLMSAAKRKE